MIAAEHCYLRWHAFLAISGYFRLITSIDVSNPCCLKSEKKKSRDPCYPLATPVSPFLLISMLAFTLLPIINHHIKSNLSPFVTSAIMLPSSFMSTRWTLVKRGSGHHPEDNERTFIGMTNQSDQKQRAKVSWVMHQPHFMILCRWLWQTKWDIDHP